LEAWNELKLAVSMHNEKLAALFEEIRTMTIEALKIPCYYSNLFHRAPREYITIDRFLEILFEDMKLKIRSKGESGLANPSMRPVSIGSETFYELEFSGHTIMCARDNEKTERAILLIDQLLTTPKFKEEAENLIKSLDEIQKVKRTNFERKVKEVIKSIELGKILEGNCRYCP
jgi:hypothetical protein